MKHFFSYEPDGTLYQQVVIKGGFPDDCNIDDPACTHPLSIHIREVQARLQAKPDNPWTHSGMVKFECPCDESEGVCGCAPVKRLDAFWCTDTDCLRDKPAIDVLIDGSPVAHDARITRYPNQLFTCKVVAETPSEIPDGAIATLWSAEMLEDGEITLTFTGGQSNEVTLRAPAQGITGKLVMLGLHVKVHRVFIKGFATT